MAYKKSKLIDKKGENRLTYDLDDMKKVSEIINNIAQPIATLIAAYIGVKLATETKSSKSSKKRKKK
ncbi:MAG: hypothetical protein LUG12_05450 [Erysipelotrichaceae bacterium]|nr:hypothetical protein [Erysipelotrichaceae bacterium]